MEDCITNVMIPLWRNVQTYPFQRVHKEELEDKRFGLIRVHLLLLYCTISTSIMFYYIDNLEVLD